MAQPGKPIPPKAATAAKPAAPAAAKPQPAAASQPAAAAKPAPAPAAKPVATAATASGGPERARMISEAAYFLAQRRGTAGNPLADWLAAEKQIDQQAGPAPLGARGASARRTLPPSAGRARMAAARDLWPRYRRDD